MSALTNLNPSSVCSLHPSKSEHFWPRLRVAPLRLKTASAVGSIDCALRLHYALSRHPSCVGGWLAPFRLWLQTIFDCYTLANTDTSVCDYGVATLPFRCQPDTSACFPTRKDRHLHSVLLIDLWSLCSAKNRSRAAIRHHPPTHKRTDERTDFRRWHSLYLSPRAVMKSAEVSTPPGTWLALSFDRSFRQSLASPVIANSEHRCSRLHRFRCE